MLCVRERYMTRSSHLLDWWGDIINGPQFLFHVAMELAGIKKYDQHVD